MRDGVIYRRRPIPRLIYIFGIKTDDSDSHQKDSLLTKFNVALKIDVPYLLMNKFEPRGFLLKISLQSLLTLLKKRERERIKTLQNSSCPPRPLVTSLFMTQYKCQNATQRGKKKKKKLMVLNYCFLMKNPFTSNQFGGLFTVNSWSRRAN